MNNCTPTGVTPVVDDPCAYLGALRAALYQLMSGQAKSVVRNGEQWIEYQRSDTKALQHEVRRLELICDPNANRGRALRLGPYVPVNAPYRRNRTRLQ
jgi:gpW